MKQTRLRAHVYTDGKRERERDRGQRERERDPICLEQTKWMHALWESWQMNTVDRTISILETG